MGKALRSKSMTTDQQRGGRHTGRPALPLKASALVHLRQSALGAPVGALTRGRVTARTRPGRYWNRGYTAQARRVIHQAFPVNSCSDLSFRPRVFLLLNP